MVPDLIVTGCLCLAWSYLDNRKRKDAAVSENVHNSISEGDLAHSSRLSDHTSPAHSHRPLRIPLTNSTPRQTDKCLHYAGQPPTLSADISKEVFK